MNLKHLLLVALLALSWNIHAHEDEADKLHQHDLTIKLQWQHQFQFAGIYAAKEKGFYQQAGLNVDIQPGFTRPYDEVESGDVEFGISGTGIVAEYLKGRPFVALGATFQNSPYVWLVKADSGIYSASDFIGKTLTRQFYADDLTSIFLKQNIDTSKIQFVLPSEKNLDNLIDGHVDGLTAYISNEPFLMAQRQEPYRTISPQDYDIQFYSDILFTSQQYLDQNPTTVEAFRQATYKGWQYAAEHPDEIVDLILQKYNSQQKSRAHLKFEAEKLLELSLYPTVDFGHMTTHRWQQIADIYRQLGHYDEVGNLDDFLYKNQSANTTQPIWLITTLGIISFIALLSYLLKRHHNAKLTAQIRQQTESMKDELRERKALEATARHESLRLQTLLDNTIDSVITINQSGIIENYNKASVQLFGYQPDEVIGKNITMLMPASYRDQHKLGMARFLSTEETRTIGKPVEVEALHKSGNTFPIELTLSDFKWEQKHLFTGIARDISQQKAEQESLLKAKYEAERANNAKSEFLSSMSHELRTPLNGILGFSQLLLSDTGHPLNEKQRHNINQIIHSGKHLLSLINDVLELSEIESGRIKTSNDHVPIASVFEECQPLLQALAKQQNINIDFQDGTDAVVLANSTKLKQVFITLVNNAIKYNKTGGKVLVSASVQTHNSSLKLTITDTGKGISKDRQAQVFTPFERLGQERHVEGAGIGLSVSKRLIEAMGGQIDFASTEGQGTSFWIELPLSNNAVNHIDEIKKADGEQEISLSQRKTDTEVALPSKQILYIEDNPANIKLIEVFLSRFKHVSLETCETAEAGLEIVNQRKPDLILMDINLPGISGIEAAQKLHETPAFADIPLIALTAAALEENSHASQGLFTAYITKPVDFTLLARTLQPYL